MKRTLVTLAALRLLIDAADAAAELAGRFGIDHLGAQSRAGEWDLAADASLRRIALGVIVEHDPARAATWPETTNLTLHLGPLTLTATRERPAGWWLPDPDCALGTAEDLDPLHRGEQPEPWAPSDVAVPWPPGAVEAAGCPWHGALCDGTDHENHDPSMPLGEQAPIDRIDDAAAGRYEP